MEKIRVKKKLKNEVMHTRDMVNQTLKSLMKMLTNNQPKLTHTGVLGGTENRKGCLSSQTIVSAKRIFNMPLSTLKSLLSQLELWFP